MCTDGVLERLADDDLIRIFSKNTSTEVIKNIILESCSGKTRDNYSFYIISIQNVLDSVGIKQNILSLFYSFV